MARVLLYSIIVILVLWERISVLARPIRNAFLLLALGLLAPGAALAVPTIMLEVVGGSGPVNVQPDGTGSTVGDVTTWTLTDPLEIDGIMLDSWQAQFKEDPYVTNNLNVTNNTLATQTFIATVILPIPAFAYDSAINSSVGVTATDSNGNNILSFANNGATPLFQGIVNGVTVVLPLNPTGLPLTTASCAVSFPGCTATDAIGTALQALTPGVATQIGITLTFQLSPGDSAGITSRFEIVPEPGTATLLGGGLLLLAGARRRRSA
jgi:hypothetical protein